MANIFISYARKDSKELAAKLRDDLIRSTHRVWLDLREIELGGDFTKDIERAIDECDVALLLMSEGSSASQWCRMEQLRALRKGKKIIPLRAQAHTEPPLHLEHLNFIDFSDDSRYEAMLRDLLSDISASQAFRVKKDGEAHKDSPFRAKAKAAKGPDLKRNAPAFRRHIQTLRQSEWLGLRSWWTYFLFMFTDVYALKDILQTGEIVAPFIHKKDNKSQWDRYVRLHFRPRSPELFRSEGFIPAMQNPEQHTPIPTYLLFDLEALLLHPNARFSDGDPAKGHSTYATPTAFAELPFEMIYHDSWTRGHEREEIMRYREAQVLIPERLGLEALQLIWVRSEAEYETLHRVLGADLWKKWREKITPRHDFILFNHKRPHIYSATLSDTQVYFTLNPFHTVEDTVTYLAELHIQYANGTTLAWQEASFNPKSGLVVDIPSRGHYQVTLLLDGNVAYQGEYLGKSVIL